MKPCLLLEMISALFLVKILPFLKNLFLEYYYCNQILDDNCHTYSEIFNALYNNMAISLYLQKFDVDHNPFNT